MICEDDIVFVIADENRRSYGSYDRMAPYGIRDPSINQVLRSMLMSATCPCVLTVNWESKIKTHNFPEQKCFIGPS